MRRITVNNETLLDQVTEITASGQKATIRVKGDSMRPFLDGRRDKVVLQKFAELHKYDIVLAKINHRYVLHRIISINNDTITLMGDGNLVGTETCHRSAITATAIARIRGEKESRFGNVGAILWFRLRPIRRYLLYLLKKIGY